jgi:hypothetical protein
MINAILLWIDTAISIVAAFFWIISAMTQVDMRHVWFGS